MASKQNSQYFRTCTTGTSQSRSRRRSSKYHSISVLSFVLEDLSAGVNAPPKGFHRRDDGLSAREFRATRSKLGPLHDRVDDSVVVEIG